MLLEAGPDRDRVGDACECDGVHNYGLQRRPSAGDASKRLILHLVRERQPATSQLTDTKVQSRKTAREKELGEGREGHDLVVEQGCEAWLAGATCNERGGALLSVSRLMSSFCRSKSKNSTGRGGATAARAGQCPRTGGRSRWRTHAHPRGRGTPRDRDAPARLPR
jgi:hypothetical protein